MMLTTTHDIINNPEQLDKLRAFVKECEKLLKNPKQRWSVDKLDCGQTPNSWYKYAWLDDPVNMYLINTVLPNIHIKYVHDSYLVPIEDDVPLLEK